MRQWRSASPTKGRWGRNSVAGFNTGQRVTTIATILRVSKATVYRVLAEDGDSSDTSS
jgi:Helix-turn-helix domain of resolvase